MIHTIVSEFVTRTLKIGQSKYMIRKKMLYEHYIDNSVSIDEPHNTGLRMSSNTSTESSPFTFLHFYWFWFAYEHWCSSWFSILIWLLRSTIYLCMIIIYEIMYVQNTFNLHLPRSFHCTNTLDTLHVLGQL